MRDYLDDLLRDTLAGIEGVPDDFEPELEVPNHPEHGDLATNTALRLAGALERPPRQIAEDLAERLRAEVDPRRVASIEVAGPGFINFRYAEQHLERSLAEILAEGDDYGRTESGKGQKALVEYVSANPTGPLTVGHGRNAVLGDTIANMLEWTGYDVTREYYFNDAGRQMRVLAQSVRARYEQVVYENYGEDGARLKAQLKSSEEKDRLVAFWNQYETKKIAAGEGEAVEVPASFPEDGYLGEYIVEIARALYEEHGTALLESGELAPFKEAAEKTIFAQIEKTLARLGIEMDSYFNEHALYEDGAVWDVVEKLREKGYVYDEEGAVWFKTTAFEKEQDTVLVKSSGEPTYRLPDIAYHRTKFERGFDLMIDIFGADHVATYPDVLSGIEVLGYDPSRVDVVIYQFVTLVRGGKPVKMSTRRATYDTLDDLIDEVGADVARFFFLMRSPNAHLEFDLDLAKEASDKNPVFYLQYAHARICSIVDKAEEVGFRFEDEPDFSLLEHEAEEALIKELLRFPTVLEQTTEARAPHRLANYLNDVAVAFTQFYGHCRIVGEERALATARMHLARAAQITLRNGLTILGISAPEQM